MSQPPISKPTKKHLSVLLETMESHRNLAIGKLDESFKIEDRQLMWEKIAKKLNAIESIKPCSKSAEKWRKTWNNWKWYVRNKAQSIKRKDPKIRAERLSAMETRLLNLVGWNDSTDAREFFEHEESSYGDSLPHALEDDNAMLVTLLDEAEDVKQNVSDLQRVSFPVSVARVTMPTMSSGNTPLAESGKNVSTDEEETPSHSIPQRNSNMSEENHKCQDTGYEQMVSRFAFSRNKKLAMLERMARASERKATAEERKAAAEERKAIAEERKAAAEERKAAALQDIAAALLRHPLSL